MTVLKNEPSRVEAIALKQKLSASESGRILWEKLLGSGDYLTAARAIEVLQEQRAARAEEQLSLGQDKRTDPTDEEALLALLAKLQQERLMDRPRNRKDCCAMLEYCTSVDPYLASRILEETAVPCSRLSTEELFKPFKDRFELLRNVRVRSTRYSKEFVGAIYRALNVDQWESVSAPKLEEWCDICVFAGFGPEKIGPPHSLIQVARRLRVESGRMALARARAMCAQWQRAGSEHVPRKVASVWGRIRRDSAKFHIWCGVVTGDECLLRIEERPVSFVWHSNAPCVDNGAVQRLFWLADGSPITAVASPAITPLVNIRDDEEDFHYDDSDDDPFSTEDEGPNSA
eukprot:Gregarina_sp_Pseudo_9__394@NODE_1258_length_1736_cov_26_146140_g1183_i0_p1_GENE_NODE_1258_length_1736_cov_26_146140_g1183_i0NODE_1258_length_1736_cov_26_146140_g1183_i0_p1_ORF_typecomplete_len345_score42_76_NODE_1258_length_1736_cov_26_146140_g1183_i05291563